MAMSAVRKLEVIDYTRRSKKDRKFTVLVDDDRLYTPLLKLDRQTRYTILECIWEMLGNTEPLTGGSVVAGKEA